ncbi:abortive infection family protein [Luteipulveratus sp. YIM 133132]|uniref:abortive infection family protein n=1 Tax=Luteipulveratus flavus TaxID=3031728 RepID=UPI0023B06CBA|nr:abortive infection family protein [Luteipulveratus sp. YIM 133132]MDE9364741.1 abortive infection family protein [Luteipulveratus sp. YIM 133132]
MSPRAAVPLTSDIIAALAMFFHGGLGPSHTVVSRVITGTGYGDDYMYDRDVQGPNKEQRVLKALGTARREPARARDLVDELLSALRVAGMVGGEASGENVDRLRRALASAGWYLTDDGHLQPFGEVDLDTGGRPALEEQVERLRRSATDPALLIGTAKELLESVSKFVLEELGMPVNDKMDYNQLWHLARERLNVLPQQVDPNLPGVDAIRAIHQSTWNIADQANKLRNLQGTGHGRTLPTGVSEDLAMLVVREAATVAEYMLARLDREKG